MEQIYLEKSNGAFITKLDWTEENESYVENTYIYEKKYGEPCITGKPWFVIYTVYGFKKGK